jgi:hypothetical protein
MCGSLSAAVVGQLATGMAAPRPALKRTPFSLALARVMLHGGGTHPDTGAHIPGRTEFRRCTGEFSRRRAVHAEPASHGAAPALFKGLFLVFVVLVLVAAGYAGWIVIRYWDQVGV